MKSRSIALFEKSLESMLSAIEIYNKPNFSYREETFSILSVNSFELLLKARIIQIEKNRISSIFQYERRQNANGSISLKSYRKKNRTGNSVTIGLFKAFDLLVNKYGENLDPVLKKNLDALVEIRDNSIHFYNKDFELKKNVLEIGAASLKNYASLSQKWFGADLSRYNFFIMPLGFVRDLHTAECISLNSKEKKVLGFLEKLRESVNRPLA